MGCMCVVPTPDFLRQVSPGPTPSAQLPALCAGSCTCRSGVPCLGKGVWRKTSHSRSAGAAQSRPLFSSPCSGSRTFGLTGVVCLHEVSSTAAEVATLGVVAELRAGAEAQALVDVWGLHGKVMEKPHMARISACLTQVQPSYPGIRAGLARCGSQSGRHSRQRSRCARSVPHPHRCWRWWHSWSAWGLWGRESRSFSPSRLRPGLWFSAPQCPHCHPCAPLLPMLQSSSSEPSPQSSNMLQRSEEERQRWFRHRNSFLSLQWEV